MNTPAIVTSLILIPIVMITLFVFLITLIKKRKRILVPHKEHSKSAGIIGMGLWVGNFSLIYLAAGLGLSGEEDIAKNIIFFSTPATLLVNVLIYLLTKKQHPAFAKQIKIIGISGAIATILLFALVWLTF